MWPVAKTRFPERSRFKAEWTDTLDLLERELDHLSARDVILQADVDEREIRNDGMLRSNACVRSDGIVLTFQSSQGTLSFPCDKFDSWKDNVRAIALSLEALRKVDRYGVTKNAEQYRGWKALEDKSKAGSFSTQLEAWQFLNRHAETGKFENAVKDRETLKKIHRSAVTRYHDDTTGGSEEIVKRINEAFEYIDKRLES